jgi:hypothetical protein
VSEVGKLMWLCAGGTLGMTVLVWAWYKLRARAWLLKAGNTGERGRGTKIHAAFGLTLVSDHLERRASLALCMGCVLAALFALSAFTC